MKKLILLLLFHISWDSNLFAQCESNAVVFSLSPGYAKTGVVFGMEAGLWPVAGRIGVLGGPVIYSWEHVEKGKTETITDLDFTGRLVFKLTELGNNSPQLITLFGTVRGNFGASFRAYLSLGANDLLGLEPFYGTKTGPGIGVIFTTKL